MANKAPVQVQPGQVAIIGWDVRFCGAEEPSTAKDDFWNILKDGRSMIAPITEQRLGAEPARFHGGAKAAKEGFSCSNMNGGFFKKDIDILDLSTSLTENVMQQIKKPSEDANVGVVMGHLSFPTNQSHRFFKDGLYDGSSKSPRTAADPAVPAYIKEGLDPASFLAKKFGLNKGPCFSFDAACASGLYSVCIGRDYLLGGKCDMVLCGAVNMADPLFVLSGFSVFEAMPVDAAGFSEPTSATGPQISKPLDSGSQGLNPGEGGGMVALKRYEDAVRDGDTIHGVIVDVRTNNAGKGLPLNPVLQAEVDCLRDAYKRSNIDPKTEVQYVECHATGTPVGDKVEVQAIENVFDNKDTTMGSCKGNFGRVRGPVQGPLVDEEFENLPDAQYLQPPVRSGGPLGEGVAGTFGQPEHEDRWPLGLRLRGHERARHHRGDGTPAARGGWRGVGWRVRLGLLKA
jgi:3-oxoacyl-(acyl-carrier-protein) synthase